MSLLTRHIGDRLKARRLQLKMSPGFVAGQLGISLSTLENFESGDEKIPARQLLVLAEIVKISMEYFFLDFPVAQETCPTDEQQAQMLEAFRTIGSDEIRAFLIELSNAIARSEPDQGSSPSIN